MNNVITFLKNRRKAQLLNKLSNLQKLSASYLESSEAFSKLINSNYTAPCCTCNFQACYFNHFLDDSYRSNFSDVFYNNYVHFEHMYNTTERKIKRVEEKLNNL